jgi:hypothetical protein
MAAGRTTELILAERMQYRAVAESSPACPPAPREPSVLGWLILAAIFAFGAWLSPAQEAVGRRHSSIPVRGITARGVWIAVPSSACLRNRRVQVHAVAVDEQQEHFGADRCGVGRRRRRRGHGGLRRRRPTFRQRRGSGEKGTVPRLFTAGLDFRRARRDGSPVRTQILTCNLITERTAAVTNS